MSNKRFFVVIAAAGQGSRMNSSQNKQFIELMGVPIIIRTLRTFQSLERVESIIVVAKKEEIPELEKLCKNYGLSKILNIVEGGPTRQDSVRNALNNLALSLGEKTSDGPFDLDALNNCYVLIHDGARPFVSNQTINKCMDCVIKRNSCGVGVKLKDTIKKVSSDMQIEKTINRENLWAIQTPQAFSLSLILTLHEKARKESVSFTDDTSLFEYYNKESFIIEGEYTNIKITTPEDLIFGEAIMKNKS